MEAGGARTRSSPTTPWRPSTRPHGGPRLVKNLATQALVVAYADKKAIVDESAARAAITEVTAE